MYKSTDAKRDRLRLLSSLAPLLVVPDDVEIAAAVLAGQQLPKATFEEYEFQRLFKDVHGQGLLNLLGSPCPRAEELLDWAKVHLVDLCRGCL